MKIPRPIPVTLFLLLILLAAGCVTRGYIPNDKQSLNGSGKLYFIPLGDFPSSTIEDLIDHYQSRYGLSIETLPSLPLNSSVVDSDRRQLIAESVIALMKNAYPELTNSPEAIMIGLTTEDMYIAQYNWQFTFSWREEGKYAVVSNARMGLGLFISEERVKSRLRKMLTKNIGILYYRLPQSNNPRSVLYKNIGGISELDFMGEEF